MPNILTLAGLTFNEQALCRRRYRDSGMTVTYNDWCKGYVLLNSTKTAEQLGLAAELPKVQQALLSVAVMPKPKDKKMKLKSDGLRK